MFHLIYIYILFLFLKDLHYISEIEEAHLVDSFFNCIAMGNVQLGIFMILDFRFFVITIGNVFMFLVPVDTMDSSSSSKI